MLEGGTALRRQLERAAHLINIDIILQAITAEGSVLI
jgi:hypothetical protein